MNGNHGEFDCRWEVSEGTARVHFGANAYANILKGHSVQNVTVSKGYLGNKNVRSYVDGTGLLVNGPI